MIPPPHEQRESARQRALRIRLDYVARRDGLGRWKLRLTAAAFLLAVLYCGAVVVADRFGAEQLCPAPVSAAHAHFADDCQACHVPFVPLRDDASTFLARLLRPWPTPAVAALANDARAAQRATTAARCKSCHAAAAHHRLERPEQVESCATCHQEHRGSTAQLAEMSDERCTTCHRAIVGHRSGASALDPALVDVRQFAAEQIASSGGSSGAGHPEFRSLRSDPGTIKFDHRLHMTPGLPRRDADGRSGRPLKSLADLPPAAVERYRGSAQPAGVKPDDQYLVSLDCGSCHRGDESTGGSAPSGPHDVARYQPIRFDRDCQACHSLPFDAARRDATLPHGLDPDAIRTYLRRFYSTSDPASKDDELGPWTPRRPRPASPLTEAPVPGRAGDDATRAEVDRNVSQQVTLAVQFLERQQVCVKCHDVRRQEPTAASESQSRSAAAAAINSPGESSAANPAVPSVDHPPLVERAGIPATWFHHARFDHRPHRMVECAECHVGTRPQPTDDSAKLDSPQAPDGTGTRHAARASDRDVVMIGGRDLCLRCHGGSTNASTGVAAARSDCVLCHRYHGADRTTARSAVSSPVPGEPAAAAPPASPRRSIREWLEPARRQP